MAFTKQGPFSKKVSDLPDVPSNNGYTAADIKTYMENPSDELMTTLNNLIDALLAAGGDSGAKSLGAMGFDGEDSNVQALLDFLNDNKADDARVDNIVASAGDSNTEIVDARENASGTVFPNLKKRLDNSDSQLAETMNRIGTRISVIEKGAVADGSQDISQALQEAHDQLVATNNVVNIPGGIIVLPSGIFTINSTVNITESNITIKGMGFSSILQNGSNITMINVNGASYFSMMDLKVNVTDLNRTNYPVTVQGNHSRPYFKNVYFNGADGSYRSGISIVSGSMGLIEDCMFNHACIYCETWDVKVAHTWIWAMSCEYGIGLFKGCGNFTAVDVDIVSPLTSNVNGKSGIWVDGDSGACYNLHFEVYLDGNPTLSCREGIIINHDSGNIFIQAKSNQMDSDCIVIDSAIGIEISNYKGNGNNASGTGSREIFIKKTGTQNPEVKIHDFDMTRTTDITGTKASAITVDSSVTDQSKINIYNGRIYQASTLGGYSNPEISCDSSQVNLQNIVGTASKYKTHGSISVPSGSSGITVSFGAYPMAYEPQAYNYLVNFEGVTVPTYRIQKNGTSNFYLAFATNTTAATTLDWKVDLCK